VDPGNNSLLAEFDAIRGRTLHCCSESERSVQGTGSMGSNGEGSGQLTGESELTGPACQRTTHCPLHPRQYGRAATVEECLSVYAPWRLQFTILLFPLATGVATGEVPHASS
jgi:hypothetical protein